MYNKNQDFNNLYKNITQPTQNTTDKDDDLDAKLNLNKKKHRNTIQFFDSCFQNITHPFVLLVMCIIVILVFLVFRYMSLHIKIAWIVKAANDIEIFIGYFFTVIITYIITSFIDHIKRLTKEENI